jgi:hypothetical protein
MRALSVSYFAALALVGAVVVLWPSQRTAAVDRDRFSMEILVDGVPLPEHVARGRTYVEALEGKEYTVRLTNRTGERVAVALAVDGLNSIDAKRTSARDARKWILDPWQSVTLEGWQTSGATARRFYFTTEKDSYGAWLGRTKNLGLVSAAFFREKRPEPVRDWSDGGNSGPERRREAPSAAREKSENESKAQGEADALAGQSAATGIGREVDHRVRRVSFDQDDSPAAVVEVRYEYRDALVRLGVLPRPRPACDDTLTRRERARGFEDGGYAPDPFRR